MKFLILLIFGLSASTFSHAVLTQDCPDALKLNLKNFAQTKNIPYAEGNPLLPYAHSYLSTLNNVEGNFIIKQTEPATTHLN